MESSHSNTSVVLKMRTIRPLYILIACSAHGNKRSDSLKCTDTASAFFGKCVYVQDNWLKILATAGITDIGR